jgi:hypothetical protein
MASAIVCQATMALFVNKSVLDSFLAHTAPANAPVVHMVTQEDVME